jgi:hypothetical protein
LIGTTKSRALLKNQVEQNVIKWSKLAPLFCCKSSDWYALSDQYFSYHFILLDKKIFLISALNLETLNYLNNITRCTVIYYHLPPPNNPSNVRKVLDSWEYTVASLDEESCRNSGNMAIKSLGILTRKKTNRYKWSQLT